MTDDVLGSASDEFTPVLYALSAFVYAERDGQILLLERAGGALEGSVVPTGRSHRGQLVQRIRTDLRRCLQLIERT